MQRRVYPEIEFVSPESLQEAENRNQVFLEAKYSGDVAKFRADVIARMIGQGALRAGTSFLLYRDQFPTDTNLLIDGEAKETLIMLASSKKDSELSPHIKVVTNTEFHNPDFVAFMTEDVTVDRDDDAQMLIDVAIFDHEGGLVLGLDENESKTKSYIFAQRGDSDVCLVNHSDYTPLMQVNDEISVGGGEPKEFFVAPFGIYTHLEDKISALEWANRILADTDNAELVAWSH